MKTTVRQTVSAVLDELNAIDATPLAHRARRFAGRAPRRHADQLLFLRQWLRSPLKMGAVAPSGPALAARMAALVDPALGPVIELGVGTGVLTRALLERGVAEEQLVLVERDRRMADLLLKRFPRAQVIAQGAQDHVYPFGRTPAGAVVSGLPLLAMPNDLIDAIVSLAFERMHPDGRFIQFTYGLRTPIPREVLQRHGLVAHRVGWELRNAPPAAVYCFERPSHHR